MKLLEAILGIFLLGFVFSVTINYIFLSNKKLDIYTQKIKDDSEKISLYNYSNKLISKTKKNTSWYIYLSWNKFFTGESGKFFYECSRKEKKLLKINKKKKFLFCKINTEENYFYNYKLLN